MEIDKTKITGAAWGFSNAVALWMYHRHVWTRGLLAATRRPVPWFYVISRMGPGAVLMIMSGRTAALAAESLFDSNK